MTPTTSFARTTTSPHPRDPATPCPRVGHESAVSLAEAADRPVAKTLPSVAGTDTRADSCSHGLHLMPTHARDPGPRSGDSRATVRVLPGGGTAVVIPEPLSSLHRRVLMELSRLNHGGCGALSGGGGIRHHELGCTPSPVFRCVVFWRSPSAGSYGVWRLRYDAALLNWWAIRSPARVSLFLTERQRDGLVQCRQAHCRLSISPRRRLSAGGPLLRRCPQREARSSFPAVARPLRRLSRPAAQQLLPRQGLFARECTRARQALRWPAPRTEFDCPPERLFEHRSRGPVLTVRDQHVGDRILRVRRLPLPAESCEDRYSSVERCACLVEVLLVEERHAEQEGHRAEAGVDSRLWRSASHSCGAGACAHRDPARRS